MYVNKGTVVKAEDTIINKDILPEGTTYTWRQEPNADQAGYQLSSIFVKYPDGTMDRIYVTVKVNN